MRRVHASLVIVIAVFVGAATLAQEQGSSMTYSSPLDDLSLDSLFPVRSPSDVTDSMQVAKLWQEGGQRFLDHVNQFDSRIQNAAKLKQSELATVKTRKQQAKKTDNSSEKAAALTQIQTDEKAIAMLKDIDDLLSLEKRYAQNLIAAGKALERVNELEREAADRRQAAINKRGAEAGATMKFRNMDPEVSAKQRELVAAYKEYGKRVQEMGGLLVEYSERREKLLAQWKAN